MNGKRIGKDRREGEQEENTTRVFSGEGIASLREAKPQKNRVFGGGVR